MINRGGKNVSPQEVEQTLMAHPSVAQAVAFPAPHARWGEDVVAAVVLHPNRTATASALRQFTAARLAAFKVPSQIRIVASIPASATGKRQRRRLAQAFGLDIPPRADLAAPTSGTAPRTPLEAELANLWATVLDLSHSHSQIAIDDNFFQLGGDSLLASQLLAHVRETLHADLALRQFFETPTIADMARHLTVRQPEATRLPEPPLHAVPKDVPLPLSYAQQRMWFLHQLGLSRHAYHLLEAVRLSGPLATAELEQALQEIVKRHDILRTRFIHIGGEPRQVIAPDSYLPVSTIDLQDLPPSEQTSRVRGLAQTAVQESFTLAQGPLIRAKLVQLEEREHILLLTMHHIVSDGWSHAVFWRELAAHYDALTTGQAASLPALAIQYGDFAHWQQQWLQGEVLAPLIAYWKRQLSGVSALTLPTDHPRPAVQTFRGARHMLTLSPALTQDLKTLSQQHRATLFMTLLAAFQALLHRYSDQDDMAIGTLLANRNRASLEPLTGFFVNTLVLRTDLSGDPNFRELLARVREVTLNAYEHQDLPYEKLLEELRPPRDLSRHPLFQIMFVLHNTPRQTPALSGLAVDPVDIDPGTARFDITLEFWESQAGLRGRFEYSTDLFEAATIRRMGGHLQTLLEGIVAAPEQPLSSLPLLTAAERHLLMVTWNATAAPYPNDQCIHEVFERQAAQTPDAVALICHEMALSYRDLNRRANRVAHYLLAIGVGTETLVGLYMQRSVEMVVGVLGILKAGAAYLPLDPTYPPERLAFMLDDAQPAIVLTQAQLAPGLPEHGARQVDLDTHWATIAQYDDRNPAKRATAENLAYVLYTSGSTGRPKGVLGLHRATLNAWGWMGQTFPFAADEAGCQKTSISFGDSIQELFGPLLRGVRLVLVPDDVLRDFPRFVQTLAHHRVTRIVLVPSLLRVLLDTFHYLHDRLPHLKLWFAGGEALSIDLCQRFREQLPDCRLVNLYGASEASDDTSWYETHAATHHLTSVPIGRPIANTQVYVLDAHMQPVPIGIPGELFVAGDGLARGYLNRPQLTAERFIPHAFNRDAAVRLYQTGDLVRYQPDGNIEYLGRSDHQIKLRGVRIELGEIEVALARHPDVKEAVVIVSEDGLGEPRLVAYAVPMQAPGPAVRELRRFLEQQLPAAMLPAHMVMLTALPLTPSGKVNRQALPEPSPARPDLEAPYHEPRTPLEQQVAAVWRHLLGLERVGLYDNFFELGGHSLLAMQLLFRISEATHVNLALLDFFASPTVIEMVALIEAADARPGENRSFGIAPRPRGTALPVTIAQEQFWLFDQAFPGLSLSNVTYVMQLQGHLNPAILEQSFNAIIERHEVLRTTFTFDTQMTQVIASHLPLTLAVTDLQDMPEDEREETIRSLIQEAEQRPFDLIQGPLLRGAILQVDEQTHLLLLTLHHIICDGWSLGVLVRELAAAYEAIAAGVAPALPALPIQYADFAVWQRQWQRHPEMRAQLAYWQTQLHDPLPVLLLPTDHPRTAAVSVSTARQPFTFSTALLHALRELSQQEGCTLFMTCLTAFNLLLYAYTGQADVMVATLVANRTRRETEGLIGLLVNTVLLRTDLGGNPRLADVLQRVHAGTLAAYAHQDLPFEDLIRTLESERHFQRASLCQVMMIWHNTMVQPYPCSTEALRFETMDQDMVGALDKRG